MAATLATGARLDAFLDGKFVHGTEDCFQRLKGATSFRCTTIGAVTELRRMQRLISRKEADGAETRAIAGDDAIADAIVQLSFFPERRDGRDCNWILHTGCTKREGNNWLREKKLQVNNSC